MPESTKYVLDWLSEKGLRVVKNTLGSEFAHADLIAWGIIPIEAKQSTDHGRQLPNFVFRFSRTQQSILYLSGFTVLSCKMKDSTRRNFVLPNNHPLITGLAAKQNRSIYVSLTKTNPTYLELLPFEDKYRPIIECVLETIPGGR